MTPLRLVLPFPPPLSALFTNVPRRGRVPTQRYLTWQRAAMNEIMLQNRNPPRSFRGYVHMHVVLGAPDARCRDGDNHLKAIQDTLVKMHIIPDDSNRVIRRGTWEWADVKGAVVTVASLVQEVA